VTPPSECKVTPPTYLAPHFRGGIAVLPAGSNVVFWDLPPETLSWECGFSVETATVRERADFEAVSGEGVGTASALVWLGLAVVTEQDRSRVGGYEPEA
jgi:hypothetical protein